MSQIVYQILEPKYLEQTISCVTEVFVGSEPLTKSLHITESEFYRFAEIFCNEAARDLMSHVAIDSECDRVIGFAISRDYLADPPEGLISISEKFIPIIGIIQDLRTEYAKTRKLQNGGMFFYVFMIGVNQKYRRQGIGKTLVQENVKNAGKKGFTYAVCDSTNRYSQRTFFSSGFQEICAIEYQNNNKPVFEPFKSITLHKKCMFLEKVIAEKST